MPDENDDQKPADETMPAGDAPAEGGDDAAAPADEVPAGDGDAAGDDAAAPATEGDAEKPAGSGW